MKQFLKNLLAISLLALFVPVQSYVHFEPLLLAMIVIGLAVIATLIRVTAKADAALCGVTVEIWVKYIIEKFWKQNPFLAKCWNDDQYVVGGSIVHIPQPGANPIVVKNRTVYPATAVRRTDTDIVFALDVYTTDPTHITDAEKVELSYDKMDSVLGDHTSMLNQVVAEDIITKWLTGITSFIRTSGTAAAATVTGQTGTRKVFVHGDLRKAQLVMNLQEVPAGDRYVMLEANMADQLFESLSNTQYRDFSQYANAETGVIGKLYGFEIMTRSSVSAATSADSVLPLGTAIGATDNLLSIAWQKNAVTRALGEVKIFSNPNRAEYYGDIMSALLRAGARRRRADDKGIIAIAQSA